jgi:DNA-nicking Smr family endonuclease
MKPATFKAFQALGDLVRERKLHLVPSNEKPLPTALPWTRGLSDQDLFLMAMRDVFPLGWSSKPLGRRVLPVEVPNPRESEDEGLKLLMEFVSGKGAIDLIASGEYIEGAPDPGGHVLLEQLRTGHFAVQAHLDLHGLAVREARESLEKFIRRSLHLGHGCVRIIHGRGRHSLGGHALLKEHLQKWLGTRRMARHIVAYTSAPLCDGGGGALYVLLRKRLR